MKLSEISTKDGEVIAIGKFMLLVGPNNVELKGQSPLY